MTNKSALIIFIKTPLPHQVKTRLQPQVSAEESALIYSAFIRDLDQRYQSQKTFDCWYAVAPENFDPDILSMSVNLSKYFKQQGADLGERMSHAFRTIFSKGYTKIALIGSDVPTLSLRIIQQTFRLLDTKDCVIGPGFDGGYYLIALRNNYPFLFSEIPWSTSAVYEKTLEKFRNNDLNFSELSVQRDIDTMDDLQALYKELKKVNKHSEDFPGHTRKALQSVYRKK